MSTQQSTVDFIMRQLASISGISTNKMFGEYGIRCEGKIVALVCDDQLFVKPTGPGRELAADAAEIPPYPGAKPSLLIVPNRWEDAGWLSALIRATADALPTHLPERRSPAKT
ncbi:MAG: TfoX/Sxy family protein [Acetobacter sp.]|nr:TfoX/Sxy family protein [Acetobacter sp.]